MNILSVIDIIISSQTKHITYYIYHDLAAKNLKKYYSIKEWGRCVKYGYSLTRVIQKIASQGRLELWILLVKYRKAFRIRAGSALAKK
jgi:hypothetical protein